MLLTSWYKSPRNVRKAWVDDDSLAGPLSLEVMVEWCSLQQFIRLSIKVSAVSIWKKKIRKKEKKVQLLQVAWMEWSYILWILARSLLRSCHPTSLKCIHFFSIHVTCRLTEESFPSTKLSFELNLDLDNALDSKLSSIFKRENESLTLR